MKYKECFGFPPMIPRQVSVARKDFKQLEYKGFNFSSRPNFKGIKIKTGFQQDIVKLGTLEHLLKIFRVGLLTSFSTWMLSQSDKKYGVVPPLESSKLLLFLIGQLNSSFGSIMEYSSKLIKLSNDPDPGLISLVISAYEHQAFMLTEC